MRTLRIGVIGLGVGEKHIDGYQAHSQCEVIKLCDFSLERLTEVGARYPHCDLVVDADDVLTDPNIDVVSIASYDDAHYSQIVKAIGNNKHVFVEKPICLYDNELKHIRLLLLRNPHLQLSSNLILRMSPRFQRLRKRLQANEFGTLFHVEGDYNYGRIHKVTEGWRGTIDFYSVMYGGGIHLIDLLLWLTGDKIVEVTAYGNNIVSEDTQFKYNDFEIALLKFESGMIGKVSANFGCVYPHFHRLSIYGTDATFVNGFEHATIYHARDSHKNVELMTEAYPGVHKGDLLHSFIESILTASIPAVSIGDVFKAMSICLAINKSISENKSITVEYI